MSKGNHVLIPSFLTSTSASRSIFKPNKQSAEKFEVLKKINGGRNKLFLIRFSHDPKPYVLKLYPHEHNSKLCNRYINESRFTTLDHPNIIKFFECRPNIEFESNDETITSSSCIIMEYEPAGDLGTFILSQKRLLPEPLIRGWFHQLVDALSYMHSTGNYHLDIKLPNVIMSNFGTLKLADFDISAKKADNIKHFTKGTKNFRAPEVLDGSSKNPVAADVYSLGISLFVLKTGGYSPYTEDQIAHNYNLFDMMCSGDDEFWKLHQQNLKVGKEFFDDSFKDLFHRMTAVDQASRLTIEGIKRTKWYNGPALTKDEINHYFNSLNEHN